MKRKMGMVAGAVIVLAAAVYFFAADKAGEREAGERTAENIKQMVSNYSAGGKKGQSASITSHQLIVTDKDGAQTVYALPEDEFFVSIAPYVEHTHPCAIHSLTGCRGEMANETFTVHIADAEGHVVMDGTVQSPANGFIDLWLPRNKTLAVRIENGGKQAEAVISTFEGDNTCITTMQLL